MNRYKNVQRRSNGVYYLRVYVPTQLIPRFGCREITRSLGTNCLRQAEDSKAMQSVGARISGNYFVDGSMSIEANKGLVRYLEANKAAYWIVSAGIYETAFQKYINIKNENYYRYASELMKYAKSPVVAQGGVWGLRAGAKIIKLKQGVLVWLGRALISDPDLIKKSKYGQEDKIIPCIGGIHPSKGNRCRYIKRKDLIFDCVRPDGYHPSNSRWRFEAPAEDDSIGA